MLSSCLKTDLRPAKEHVLRDGSPQRYAPASLLLRVPARMWEPRRMFRSFSQDRGKTAKDQPICVLIPSQDTVGGTTLRPPLEYAWCKQPL